MHKTVHNFLHIKYYVWNRENLAYKAQKNPTGKRTMKKNKVTKINIGKNKAHMDHRISAL